jgi:Na+-transporting NADH:ubiquinone oxidoreductase subunit NqrD
MALQARMPVDGQYVSDVLPALLVTAAGLGLGFVAATIAATAGVSERQQGLASGLLNTSQQIGGSLGLAVLATIAASRTSNELANEAAPVQALTDGFSLGFGTAIGFALVAAAVALLAPRRRAGAIALAAHRTDETAAPGTAPALAGAPAVDPTREADTHD